MDRFRRSQEASLDRIKGVMSVQFGEAACIITLQFTR